MSRYQVRSKELVDVVNEMKSGRLVISPYFQRDLVWRLVHKIDFIKTILLGFPFPQIFISRGSINVEDMTSTSVVVDGQQRLNSIQEFIGNKFKVNGKGYNDLSSDEKEAFLKYEIAVIDLDLKDNDPKIIEIFKRLNRTFYSLSNIEKMATEFAASEFMLVAKLLTKQIYFNEEDEDYVSKLDPNIPPDFIDWAKSQDFSPFNQIILESPIFSAYEISRKVHLMFALNVLATIIGGFYGRNELVVEYLEKYSEGLPDKTALVKDLSSVARYLKRVRIKANSYWYNKANMFSLICALYKANDADALPDHVKLRRSLEEFEAKVPAEYAIAAKEAVNNKRERLLRHKYVVGLIGAPQLAIPDLE